MTSHSANYDWFVLDDAGGFGRAAGVVFAEFEGLAQDEERRDYAAEREELV
jgi:hypothetical protein